MASIEFCKNNVAALVKLPYDDVAATVELHNGVCVPRSVSVLAKVLDEDVAVLPKQRSGNTVAMPVQRSNRRIAVLLLD